MGNQVTKSERAHRETFKEQKIQEVKKELIAETKTAPPVVAIFNQVKISQLDRGSSPFTKTDFVAIVLKLKHEDDIHGIRYQTMTVKDLRALIRILIYQQGAIGYTDSTTLAVPNVEYAGLV